ncbi:TetR/AcrR family transcriptional regulator [Paenibacillus sinopodophylli]|uniref:TetR/AcrR family transcriptional regulator n=1 Tax=Paenibacillus sinopodophylli TaxID=1837342 RepID=UPI00110CF370|nr:TetR/AcrR family transcriptional regulator [Paenibacillus sinopodophylli]
MLKIDRRILKSQEAIKKAVVELMLEQDFDSITIQGIADRANVSRKTIYLHYTDKFDLLDKLIAEHIDALEEMCHSETEGVSIEGSVSWFKYFERHYLFFSALLASKGASFFRSRFLEFVTEDIRKGWEMSEAKIRGIPEDIVLQFIAPAYVGIVEWWFTKGMPYPPEAMEEKVGMLLESNLM